MNIELIRKLGSISVGKRYLEERFESTINPISEVFLRKAASASDPDLLKLASRLTGDTLEVYEALGGTFTGHTD